MRYVIAALLMIGSVGECGQSMPTYLRDRIVCSVHAAREYKIPASIMLAVAEQEAGRPGTVMQNDNGTFDVGPMQFNSSYLRTLPIRPEDVSSNYGCYAYRLAAWRIKNHLIKDSGPLLKRVANYHSKTDVFNRRYREQLRVRIKKWESWIDRAQALQARQNFIGY